MRRLVCPQIPLLMVALWTATPAVCDAQVTVIPKSHVRSTRLHLTTHAGSLRLVPPYSRQVDPFLFPSGRPGDRFGLVGAIDLIQTSSWRFGLQVDGVYTDYGLPYLVRGTSPWRRRIVIYGTWVGSDWVVTLGIPIHDTGPRYHLQSVLPASNSGAAVREFLSDQAYRKAGAAPTARAPIPKDMRKVSPRDDVVVPLPPRARFNHIAKKRLGSPFTNP